MGEGMVRLETSRWEEMRKVEGSQETREARRSSVHRRTCRYTFYPSTKLLPYSTTPPLQYTCYISFIFCCGALCWEVCNLPEYCLDDCHCSSFKAALRTSPPVVKPDRFLPFSTSLRLEACHLKLGAIASTYHHLPSWVLAISDGVLPTL